MITAFDFDGTLTNNDTLLGFFLEFKTPLRYLKIPLYFFAMIMAKLKVISNSKLKIIGILLFLDRKSKNEIEQTSKRYAEAIRFNKIYYNYYSKADNPIIISASFYEYLQFIFPENIIIASQLRYDDNGFVNGLSFNCYSDSKLKAMYKKNINYIDVFYTDDPISDKSIIGISKNIFLVVGGRLKEYNIFPKNIFKMIKRKSNIFMELLR